ncbi:MAG: hypothetical protein WB783_14865 [Arenicellales bacterium]|jgi:uncharacterized membrane protein
MATPAAVVPAGAPPLVNGRYLAAALVTLAVMAWATVAPSMWFLDFVHVFSGLLWTGIDLFMGFVVGPVLRRTDLAARRQVVRQLMPRMLYLMPTLAISTGTSGWFLAERLGFTALPYPAFVWVLSALVIITVLTIQGLGILLPTNLRVYLEMRKDEPDIERVGRAMALYVRVVGMQGLLQIVIIVIMAHFATGL